MQIFQGIHTHGTTLIIVQQSVNVALTLFERAVFMEKGEVRFTGPAGELLERPDVLRSVFLEGAASALGVEANGKRASARRKEKTAAVEAAAEATTLLALSQCAVSFGVVMD